MTTIPMRLWPDSPTILERSKSVFLLHWNELLRLKREAMNCTTPTVVHELSHALYRFRAALELFYPLIPQDCKTELRQNIRKLTSALGKLRTYDEAAAFFESKEALTGPVCRRITELYAFEVEACTKALKGFYHNHFDREVRKMIGGINEASIIKRSSISLLAFFSDNSIRMFLPIHQNLSGVCLPVNRPSRQVLCTAIKKWHFFFEIIAPILERDYSKIIMQLTEYQLLLEKLTMITDFESLILDLKMLPTERAHQKVMLREEEQHLLTLLANLIEQKPLAYTFLI